jgi:hypothetical protein
MDAHFTRRRPEVASGWRVSEVGQPGPQSWKRRRLIELVFEMLTLATRQGANT